MLINENVVAHIKNRLVFLLILMSIGFGAFPTYAVVTLQKSSADRPIPVRALIRNNQVYVALPSVSAALGYTLTRGNISFTHNLKSQTDSIVLIEGAAWYTRDDTTYQMRAVPILRSDTLFVAASEIPGVFTQGNDPGLLWDEVRKVIEPRLLVGLHAGTSLVGSPVRDSQPHLKSSAVPPAAKEKLPLIRTIVLDPGHGGKDPGAIGPDGIQEKNIVLPLALMVRDGLKARGGFKIYLTRETDVFIPLRQRTKFANSKKADLFVSIHANSVGGQQRQKDAKGYKIYFLSQAKNEEDKLIAMRENSVVDMEAETDKGSYLQNILVDLVGNEYLAESEDVSILIAEEIATSMPSTVALNKGVGQANFWVLNGSYMPSVLIETGFISHPEEQKLLADKSYQRKMAEAIADAVVQFRQKIEKGL